MRYKAHFMIFLILVICGVLLLMPLAAHAQDGTQGSQQNTSAVAEENESPAGVGLFIMLLGIAGVTAVGIAMMARDNFRSEDEAES